MSIAILYESLEWSSYQMQKEIEKLGVKADLIYLEEDIVLENLRNYKLIVSRIFASAVFRGHQKSLAQMDKIIKFLNKENIPMVNPTTAHFYEIDKSLSTQLLKVNNIRVPHVYGVFSKDDLFFIDNLNFPCIIKPNCGGRTNATFIIHNKEEIPQKIQYAPNVDYIVQDYINPEYNYITRIEVIDGNCKLILKRSVVANGLSAYNLGSTYTTYNDCNTLIKDTALKAMELLSIECGSMDIVENSSGFYIIDVNSVSNASQDNKEMFNFDIIEETAKYIINKYNQNQK